MKTFLPFAATLAALVLGFQPCPAQPPGAPTSPPIPRAPANPPIQAEPKAADIPGLPTRVFRVPADFLSKGGTPARDPFASGLPAKPDAQSVLKSLGISFAAPGSTATYSPDTSRLVVRNTQEQLDLVESVMEATFGSATNPVQEGQVHLELFSMLPLTARKTLIARPKEAELYAFLESTAAKQDGTVQLEQYSMLVVRSGQKSKVWAITEVPYATESSLPQIPQHLSLPVAATGTATPSGDAAFAPWPRTGITPQSIELRTTGLTFEVELTFTKDGRIVDLNLAPETSRRIGTVKWGLLEEVHRPVFETRRISAQVSNFTGQPILVGTFSPPVNTGVPGGNTVDRTWLLFVTVKKPE